MNDDAAYGSMLLLIAVGLICGAAIGYSYAGQRGITLGHVTATAGVLTVTGEGTLVDGLTTQTAGGNMAEPLGRGISTLASCLWYNLRRPTSSAPVASVTSPQRALQTPGPFAVLVHVDGGHGGYHEHRSVA